MRSLGVILISCGVGASTGLVVGGLAGLVWGAIAFVTLVNSMTLVGALLGAFVGALAGAFVGLVAGVIGAAVLVLAHRVEVPALLGRIAAALAASVAGAAAAALSFGSYLAFPVPIIGGVFMITALAAGLEVRLIESMSRKRGLLQQTPELVSTT